MPLRVLALCHIFAAGKMSDLANIECKVGQNCYMFVGCVYFFPPTSVLMLVCGRAQLPDLSAVGTLAPVLSRAEEEAAE